MRKRLGADSSQINTCVGDSQVDRPEELRYMRVTVKYTLGSEKNLIVSCVYSARDTVSIFELPRIHIEVLYDAELQAFAKENNSVEGDIFSSNTLSTKSVSGA